MMQFYVDDLIKNALLEDINYIDTTADYLLGEEMSTGRFLAKADGVLCGPQSIRAVGRRRAV